MTDQVYLPILSPISIEKWIKMTFSEPETDWPLHGSEHKYSFKGYNNSVLDAELSLSDLRLDNSFNSLLHNRLFYPLANFTVLFDPHLWKGCNCNSAPHSNAARINVLKILKHSSGAMMGTKPVAEMACITLGWNFRIFTAPHCFSCSYSQEDNTSTWR